MERWTNWVSVQSSVLLFGSIFPLYSCEPSFQFSSRSLCIGLGLGPVLTSGPKDNNKSTTCLLCTMCLKYIISIDLHSDPVRKILLILQMRKLQKVDNLFKVIQLRHSR